MLDENQANENETSILQLWQEESGVWQGDNQTARDRRQRLAQKQKPAGEDFSPAGLDSNQTPISRVSESLAP